MKKIINYILSFILFLLLVLITLVFINHNSLKYKSIINALDTTNYYNSALNNINDKIDDRIIDVKLNKLLTSYFTKDMIKNDINKILINIYNYKKISINHTKEITILTNDITLDQSTSNKISNEINSIYLNNLFLTNDFRLINSIYIGTNNTLFINSICIFIIVILITVLVIINNNTKYIELSILSHSILFIGGSIFYKIINLFKNLNYGNNYFSNFLVKLINNMIFEALIIGLISLIIVLIIKHKNSKKNVE